MGLSIVSIVLLGLLRGLLPQFHVCLLGMRSVPGRLRTRQLRDVENQPDTEVEFSQDGSELRDKVELHDLTQ